MDLRTLSDLQSTQKEPFSGSLLRLDLNLPLDANNSISDPIRLVRSKPTLDGLREKGYVVIMGHFGRPKAGVNDPNFSLKKLLPALEEILQTTLVFIDDIYDDEALKRVTSSSKGDVFILENLRFYKGEKDNNVEFAKRLAQFAPVYVNDAFSVSHRADASIEAITHLLPSYAGISFEHEITTLSKFLESPTRPVAAVVGGSKISTKLPVLKKLVTVVDYLIVAGAMVHTFLEAKGYELGGSLVEGGMLDEVSIIEKQAQESGCKIILPLDMVCCSVLQEGADFQVLPVDGILPELMAVDFGPRTLTYYESVLKHVKTVLWNGPLGVFEIPPFDEATKTFAKLLKQLTEKGVITIAGGGDTLAALRSCECENALTYISTAGGAFLELLEGKDLPGVKALLKKD